MIDEIERRARQGNFPMNVCMEMRFMGESKSLLCPAVVGQHSPNKEVKTAYIEVLSLVRRQSRLARLHSSNCHCKLACLIIKFEVTLKFDVSCT